MATILNYNRLILAGRLTRDPESKETSEKKPMCKFGLAVSRRTPNPDDAITDYFTCICFGSVAKTAATYLSKGTPVVIVGTLEGHPWTTESGEKRYSYNVKVDDIRFVESIPKAKKPDVSAEIEPEPEF